MSHDIKKAEKIETAERLKHPVQLRFKILKKGDEIRIVSLNEERKEDDR